ncbi:MAG: transporter [Herbinix sp.]|jgi:DHA3 family macrolide efflux protein-like MFS transporter|nr:transporter [Herbinix sp.]
MQEQNINLWRKKIILFLSSQTISLFGSSLVQYAIMWYITLNTQSGVMMMISIICGFLPTFFVSPFAGVWADRFSRKLLIIVSDTFIASATLVLAILFLLGYDSLWLMFVVSAIRSVGTGIQTPAVGAILPQIVPEDQLTKVNATNGSIQSLIMLVSPMVSGALLTIAPIEVIFFVDVITATIAVIIMTLFVRVPVHAKALQKQETSYVDDALLGLRYIRDHKFIKSMFIFFAAFFFMVSPAAFLTPLQTTRTFGNDVWRLTAIEIVFSIGTMAGGILLASWQGFKNRIHTMVFSSILIGLFTFALGVTPIFWLYLVFMALVGLAIPLFNTPAMVLLQEKVENDFMGRVFGVLGMISSIMMPFGMLVFGPLADVIDIEWMLIGTGLVMLLIGFVLLSNKAIVREGIMPAEEKLTENEPELAAGTVDTINQE